MEIEKIKELFKDDEIAKKMSMFDRMKVVPLNTKDVRDDRLSICERCDRYHNRFCGECHCYMPLKTFLKNVHCPLNKF